jgi:molybdate transport system substrate-binding protein
VVRLGQAADPIDLLIPGDPFFADQAHRLGTTIEADGIAIAYLSPVLIVAPGNPRRITRLADLMQAGIKVALADPGTTCLGQATRRALGDRMAAIEAGATLITHSCEQTVQAVVEGRVDVAIGWHSFRSWYAGRVELIRPAESIDIEPSAAIALIGSGSQQPELARQFREFLGTAHGRQILWRWGYATSVEEAQRSVEQLEFVRGW